jgi:hypothetical protein
VELAFFPQWVQTNAPDVQTKLHKDMKVTILVDVATATNYFLSIFQKILVVCTPTSREAFK